MAYTTDAQLLADVLDALDALVGRGAKEYRIGDRTYTSLDVDELMKLRTDLETRVNQAEPANQTVIATFRRAV